MSVVTPPDAAASVPVVNPSQAVRPGSFRWTCALVWGRGLGLFPFF